MTPVEAFALYLAVGMLAAWVAITLQLRRDWKTGKIRMTNSAFCQPNVTSRTSLGTLRLVSRHRQFLIVSTIGPYAGNCPIMSQTM